MSRSETVWIDVRKRLHKALIKEYDCPYALLRALREPYIQTPQMMIFIGDTFKTESMNRLFSLDGKKSHKQAHLHIVPGTIDCQSPIFIADCELHNATRFKREIANSTPSFVNQRLIRWHLNLPHIFDPNILANLVYTRLLSPFCTIMCLFADDLGGTRGTANILASWLINLRNFSSDLPMSTYPQIVILKRWDDPNDRFDEKLATICFMQELRQETDHLYKTRRLNANGRLGDADFDYFCRRHFGEMRVLALPLNPDVNYGGVGSQLNSLKKRLIHESEHMQKRRQTAKVAFSARHFEAFLHLAFDQFSMDLETPFSFIKASRVANPVPKDLPKHIANFVKHSSPKTLMAFNAPVVASALTLDSFPPEMHRFEPALVFQSSYEKCFENVREILFPKNDNKLFLELRTKIQDLFCKQVSDNINQSITTATAHKTVLSQFTQWKGIYSNTTCLSCIARSTENTLSCGHALCDPCTIIHSRKYSEAPWRFVLNICPLCQIPNRNEFNLKPYTAGPRCLSIDEGGSEDIKCLQLLEDGLDLPIPIQSCFDIATGSGIGGIIVLQLFCNKWTVDQCRAHFETNSAGKDNVSNSRFSQASSLYDLDHQPNKLLPLLNTASSLLLSKASSSHKSPPDSSHNLKGIFGKDKTLFDYAGEDLKIAIIATKAKEASTCIFSNYNGPEDRPISHHMIRPETPKNEMLIWQVGRATSTLLSDKPFYGYHCKDATKNNDLAKITLWEQNSIWLRADKRPDIMICLGARKVDQVERHSGWFYDHRLRYDTKECLRSCTDNLLSSLFYIELIGLPKPLDPDGFLCQAQIKCRLMPSKTAYHVLVERLWRTKARFNYNCKSVSCADRELLEEARQSIPFSKYISFNIMSLSDSVDVKIDTITRTSQSISNCPYVIQTLIQDQGLYCNFGHRDHQMRYLEVYQR